VHLAVDGHALEAGGVVFQADVVEARPSPFATALVGESPVVAVGGLFQAGDATEFDALEQGAGGQGLLADEAQGEIRRLAVLAATPRIRAATSGFRLGISVLP
jgi:hypothetical protein